MPLRLNKLAIDKMNFIQKHIHMLFLFVLQRCLFYHSDSLFSDKLEIDEIQL